MTTARPTATMTAATTPDYDEIARVVQLYLDGWRGAISKLKEAFQRTRGFSSPMPMANSTKIF